MTKVLMLASEHGGLKGGKVGGVGDVIAQLPPALYAAGLGVDVLLPSYGVYHREPDAKRVCELSVEFAGSKQRLELYRLDPKQGAGCLILHHPLFGSPPGQIYHHDPDDQPFATDANIYALFCAAAIEVLAVGALATPDVVHLHDWHAATFAVLARGHRTLRSLKLVYTIHNLALQGTRPFSGQPSSFTSWFPNFDLDGVSGVSRDRICDPNYTDCYNPTRAAINLADKIHVVSPTYAREVLESNDLAIGLHGGEGLEFDLQARFDDGDLAGILNGCPYPADSDVGNGESFDSEAFAQQRQVLQRSIERLLAEWLSDNDYLRSSDYLARETLAGIGNTLAGRFLLTSVGRVTDQKVGLLLHVGDKHQNSVLDRLLLELGDHGCLVMLGSGDEVLERALVEHAARHKNFLFLRGYSESLADPLYEAGDLFIMPSLFEPCGISQLLSMRAGQPCLVHATGGLQDTVEDELDGFVFSGADLDEKAANFELAFRRARALYNNPKRFAEMRVSAGKKRVTWQAAASAYIQELYSSKAKSRVVKA